MRERRFVNEKVRACACRLFLPSARRTATVGLCNTGFTSGCGVITPGAFDGQYALVVNASGTGPSAFIENAYPGWLPNTAVSSWIAPRFNQRNQVDASVGAYTYALSFTGAAGDTVTGQWASDNQAVMRLGSTTVASLGSVAFNSFTPFAFTLAATGAQTLFFDVNNASGPSGLRVEFTNAPEPASMALLGAGLIVAGVVRHRRRA